ncbi:MAG: type IV pilus modification protein PilV, partial [Telluria sp.]
QSALMSHGVQLATSFADRMRANSVQMRAPDSANPYLHVRYDSAADGAPALAQTCRQGSSCDSGQLARFDIHELERELHTAFPGGRTVVCRDALVWDAAQGRLSWDCTGGAADPVVIKLGWRSPDSDEGAGGPMVAISVSGESS